MKTPLPLLLGLAVSAFAAAPTPPIALTATLRTPTDIDLAWTDPRPAAGHAVEFTMNPDDPFIELGFLTPATHTFSHPRLVPNTTFYYRVRPYDGPVSNAVELTLPARISDAEFAQRYAADEDFSWAIPKLGEQASGRGGSIARPEGAPVGLKAEFVPVTVSGFQLTWTDRASDADGYMLEVKPEGAKEFTVCALMPPHTHAFGWALQPPVRKAEFRVRAYRYGAPSPVVMRRTGADAGDAAKVAVDAKAP